MGQISLTLPIPGQPFASEGVKVGNDFTTIQTWANGSVDGANVDASLTGRRLVSQATVLVGSGLAAGNYIAEADGQCVLSAGPGTTTRGMVWMQLDPANFAVVGKANTQLLVRLSVATNTVAPAITLKGQLNAVTFGGSAAAIVPTVGAQTGTSATITTPGATSVSGADSAAFAFPSAGAYALTLNTNATAAVNSATLVTMQLFVLNS